MSANARLAVFLIGALMTGAGLALELFAGGGGIALLVLGAAIIASLGLEARYGRPGAPSDVPDHAWERTRERFLDQETGAVCEVWVDRLTGERRYEPVPEQDRLTQR